MVTYCAIPGPVRRCEARGSRMTRPPGLPLRGPESGAQEIGTVCALARACASLHSVAPLCGGRDGPGMDGLTRAVCVLGCLLSPYGPAGPRGVDIGTLWHLRVSRARASPRLASAAFGPPPHRAPRPALVAGRREVEGKRVGDAPGAPLVPSHKGQSVARGCRVAYPPPTGTCVTGGVVRLCRVDAARPRRARDVPGAAIVRCPSGETDGPA